MGTTLSSNQTGVQATTMFEYWKDGGSGSMTLGEGCNFSCQWGQVNNILFRKGVRPGTKKEVVFYEADYKPQGNSYLSIYGWFENPLVEYYIIESWGSWKPPSDKRSKGTVETDSGTYDIYQNSRTGPSIKGSGTFQRYWSVRREKRTSGIITCANHFDALEKAGMTIGKFYEVSFNVEAYQSPGGTADVTVAMYTDTADIGTTCTVFSKPGSVMMQLNKHTPATLYNVLGQKMTGLYGRIGLPGQYPIMFNTSNRASGAYFSFPESRCLPGRRIRP
ncbi:MAG: glycoside hydrolase family 11 protein [Chitinispirillaceae bacterium]|nr:glycoside hydrolase family 11 protein [Chitinispirillaceae bacterium]